MKNKQKWLLISAVFVLIGFAAVSCDNGNERTDPTHTTHDWGDWKVTVPATCSEEGLQTRACKGCTETQPGKIDKAPNNHDWSDWHTVEGKAATCQETGEQYRYCKYEKCVFNDPDEVIYDDPDDTVIPIDTSYAGHNWLYNTNAVEATCVVVGQGKRSCQRAGCGTVEESANFGKNEHNHKNLSDFRIREGEYPTCDESCESYKYCSDCQKYDTHNASSFRIVDSLGGHNYPTTTPATCTTASKTFDCNNMVNKEACGHENLEQIVPALRHININWSTLNSSNGHIAPCERTGCNGGLAVVGDTGAAGGIIFYVAPSGITIQGYGSSGDNGYFAEYTAYYLEAAPENETASRWQAASDNTSIAGVTTFSSIGQNNTLTIGVGRKDTQTIVNSTAFEALTNTAAQRCVSKSLNGFTDWFLPSLGELNEFYKLKGQAGVPQTGIPTTGFFWSSSQSDYNYAWLQSFISGSQVYSSKNGSSVNRAIRAF